MNSNIILRCFITENTVQEVISDNDCVHYETSFGDKSFRLTFPKNHINSKLVEENKHILKALILNNRFPPIYENKSIICSNEYIESLIKEVDYPKLPYEKINALLLYIENTQKSAGSPITILLEDYQVYYKVYLKSSNELDFYLKTLKEKGLIYLIKSGHDYNVSLTYDGLNFIIENLNNSIFSKKCFIAMSFSKDAEIKNIREAIRDACGEYSFQPIFADEHHHETDVTVNDFMLKSMKESRFIIADFTEQKDGVYFEAGYGMGRGIKVILTCRRDHFGTSHFDTNHYPHITYDTPEELREKLINKIGAWIL